VDQGCSKQFWGHVDQGCSLKFWDAMTRLLSKYRIKQLLSVTAILAIYFLYLSTRLYNMIKRRNRITSSYHNSSNCAQIPWNAEKLITRFRSRGPIYVKYMRNVNIIENAALLKEKYTDMDVVFSDKIVSLCQDQEDSNLCTCIDLRFFIFKYFHDIVSNTKFSIFDVNNSFSSSHKYELLRDSHGILSKNPREADDILRCLGFMIALAVTSETYLEIKFQDEFLANRDYFDPWQLSRDLMSQGMRQILRNQEIKVFLNDYGYGTGNYNVDLFHSHGAQSDLSTRAILDWKKHSDYDKSTRMFWKVFYDLRYWTSQQMIMYALVTGYKQIPAEGFVRLPRTKLIGHSEPYIKIEPYAIYVPEYQSFYEMNKLLEEFIDKL
jgi:hypothetical protein